MRRAAYIIVLILVLSGTSCQKLTKYLRGPRSREVVQDSYPITVHSYRRSVVVKATPDQIVNTFVKDISRFKRIAPPSLKEALPEFEPGTDLTRTGQVIDFIVRMLGLNMPAKLITLKYEKEGENLEGWIMIVGRGSWVLIKVRAQSRAEGSLLSLEFFAQFSKLSEPIINAFDFIKGVGKQFDLLTALMQSDFDPQLSLEDVTYKDPMGKYYEELFQGYSSSIHIQAPRRNVINWIFQQTENINKTVPMLSLKDECVENPFGVYSEETASFCACPFTVGEQEVEATVINYGVWEGEKGRSNYTHNMWIIPLEQLIGIKMVIEKAGRGTRLDLIYSIEPPDMTDPLATDVLIQISTMPEMIKQTLLEIREEIESSGPQMDVTD